MPTDLTNVDPDWAWAPFEPSAERPWGRPLAAHLYRRAGFGATSSELDQAVTAGMAATIHRLCTPQLPTDDFTSTSDLLAQRATTSDVTDLAGWWLYRMLRTNDPLLEKLTLFWHGHFATSASKVTQLGMMLDQNQLLRAGGRGRFESLVSGISRDPAMLNYLDSTSNRRIHPNENYARELMELFTLGVGHYTETDIKELARAFTGWEILGDRFHFDSSQHDTGVKTFLGRSGNFNGDEAVRVVLEQPAAPRFIARKLLRFFVCDEPAAPDALVEPLAKQLRAADFQIAPVLATLFRSNLFFSEAAIGRKIKSPVELAVGLLRSLGATTSLTLLARGVAKLGLALFQPPNVKGWDGGRMWVNSSTLLGRTNLVGQILAAGETRYDRGHLAAVAGDETRPEKVVDHLLGLLVAVPVPAEARSALVSLAGEPGERDRTFGRVIHSISALPEFQLA